MKGIPRVVVHASAAPAEPSVIAILQAEGFDLVACADAHRMFEEVMRRPPDVLIYTLSSNCREDLGVLRLIQRAVPHVPLVLIATDDSLETRRITQVLRPIYYAVCPVDGSELRQAVRSALGGRGRFY